MLDNWLKTYFKRISNMKKMKRYLTLEIDTYQLPFCNPKKYRQTVNFLVKDIKKFLMELEEEGKHELHKVS
jgi:hypothetical protein